MMDMLERVAMAIYGRDEEVWHRNRNTHGVAVARAQARRVLEAMREPTDWMREAGNGEADWGTELAVWHAMIDAALAPPATLTKGET